MTSNNFRFQNRTRAVRSKSANDKMQNNLEIILTAVYMARENLHYWVFNFYRRVLRSVWGEDYLKDKVHFSEGLPLRLPVTPVEAENVEDKFKWLRGEIIFTKISTIYHC